MVRKFESKNKLIIGSLIFYFSIRTEEIQNIRNSSHDCNIDFVKIIRQIDMESWLHMPQAFSKLISTMEQVNGIGVLTNVLCDENVHELIRSEAADCVAKITSPNLNLYYRLTGFIENIKDLIGALTREYSTVCVAKRPSSESRLAPRFV